jgi:adenylate cyclase
MSFVSPTPHLAFIPVDRCLALAGAHDLPERTEGAALFADVSGFTALTQTLVAELGPKQGAEAVLTYINPVYEQLIDVLHGYRGCVIDFVGDGITCWFDESDALSAAPMRALACGLAMQTALRPFAAQQTPHGSPFHLSIKVAVAAGSARRLVVGDPAIRLLDTIAGATLTRMAEVEGQAQTGEVVAGREVVDRLGKAILVSAWRGETAVVSQLATPVPATPWPDLPAGRLPIERVRQWLLPEVYEQLQAGGSYRGDLRPVTPLMLRFGGLDFDHDPAAGEKLDAYTRWVQRVVHQYGGTLLQLTLGDKGAYLYAPFGAPVAHEDDTRRALAAALQLQAPPAQFDWLPPVQIGISQGAVWTGAYGASRRCTFGAMGRPVNLAARLMVHGQAGQTLVSDAVRRQTGFRYRHAGEVSFKGFGQPVATHTLLGVEASGNRTFEQALIGRSHELDQLEQFAQTVLIRERAGVALLYGEAGIGKSHLSYALQRQPGNPRPILSYPWNCRLPWRAFTWRKVKSSRRSARLWLCWKRWQASRHPCRFISASTRYFLPRATTGRSRCWSRAAGSCKAAPLASAARRPAALSWRTFPGTENSCASGWFSASPHPHSRPR